MDSVSVFLKTLITVTFMWCFAELIVPENKIKKFSSYIYGLIIISLTLSAFVNFDYSSMFDFTTYDDTSSYNNEYIKSVYEDKIAEILSDKFDDDSINVELNEEYLIENIYCDNVETYKKIMRYLNEGKD